MKRTEVSRATIGRIPVYLKYLKGTDHYTENISATILANKLGLGEVQVRKDLAAVSGAGRPKTGYNINEFIAALEAFLGQDNAGGVVIIGAGKLGRALLDYSGFMDYGLEVAAAFDEAVTDSGVLSNSGKPIYPMEHLEEFCKKNNVTIGVITVPADQAQSVCDRLIKNGIKGIWCFAPCCLNLPVNIPVKYENMALSLACLNNKINCHGG